MALRFRLLVVLAVVAGIPQAPCGLAQAPTPAAAPASVPGGTPELDPLPGLPRPPEAPQSLFQAAPPKPPSSCAPLPGPYFEPDARLDPSSLPPPGWFTDMEIEVLGPHVKNRLTNLGQFGTATPNTVHVPGADLDWTVAPRIEVGYRLPSGFGEFAFAYRFFATDGTGTVAGPDTVAALRSRLSVNVVDLDYASREFTYFPNWGMKWRVGLRWANAFFDTRAEESFAAAAAGSGVFETRTSNNFWGVGPHAGLELTRRFEGSGLTVVGWVDGATLLGRLRQNFFEAATTLGPDGQPLTGNTRQSASQDVPMVNAFLGLGWQPPSYPHARLSVGYQYEYWWNVGRDSNTTSRGELSDQGVLVRAELNF